MDSLEFREFEAKLTHWLDQGYGVMADDVDGELRITVMYVATEGSPGSEREQEYWPMTAEIVQLLRGNGVEVSRALAGPRSWAGTHPADLEEIMSDPRRRRSAAAGRGRSVPSPVAGVPPRSTRGRCAAPPRRPARRPVKVNVTLGWYLSSRMSLIGSRRGGGVLGAIALRGRSPPIGGR